MADVWWMIFDLMMIGLRLMAYDWMMIDVFRFMGNVWWMMIGGRLLVHND